VVPLSELPGGWADNPTERARMAQVLVDVLVALHAVDPDAVELGDFGRPEGCMARQVPRWGKQWEATQGEGTADPATPWQTWGCYSSTGTTPRRPHRGARPCSWRAPPHFPGPRPGPSWRRPVQAGQDTTWTRAPGTSRSARSTSRWYSPGCAPGRYRLAAHGIEDAVDPIVALGHHVLDSGLD